MAGENKSEMNPPSRYAAIIEAVFLAKHTPCETTVDFKREDLVEFSRQLDIALPKNLGDLLYSFRYRTELPSSILATAPEGKTWIIRAVGRAKYRFVLVSDIPLVANPNLSVTRIPDSTPGLIEKYAFNDEQAILARVRYNRLIDIFLGIACWSLQNHLRTTVSGIGQVETDEIYVGVDKTGCHYVVPVQAKGGNDKLNRVQIEQDMALCAEKMPSLVCRAIGTQFTADNRIAMFEFENCRGDIGIVSEKHYQLVSPEFVTADDLDGYRKRLSAATRPGS